MGHGDILMSIGEAKRLHKQTGQPVLIVGRDGRPIKSDLFNGIPYILPRPPRQGPYQRLVNGPGARPYIAAKTVTKWTWKPYTPEPADIVFTKDELEFAERYRGKVLIEPNIKPIGHSNKAWPYWSLLQGELTGQGIGTVQCGFGVGNVIANDFALTPTFRYAAAVLSKCSAAVLPEGGLMHAAAAVGTPAVIIWSEFISPDITGYVAHKNLRRAGPPCGSRVDCVGCRESTRAITPTEVLRALKEIL